MKESEITDKTLQCKDCGAKFAWTAGEQLFYKDKGYNEPKRCPSCRAYLKRKIEQQRLARHSAEVHHDKQ